MLVINQPKLSMKEKIRLFPLAKTNCRFFLSQMQPEIIVLPYLTAIYQYLLSSESCLDIGKFILYVTKTYSLKHKKLNQCNKSEIVVFHYSRKNNLT